MQKCSTLLSRPAGKFSRYMKNEFDVDYKDDGSPLTMADKRAHRLICKELEKGSFPAPVISEESDVTDYSERKKTGKRFWMVDPLDGTREFIKRNGEFTVNIALIEKRGSHTGCRAYPRDQHQPLCRPGCRCFRDRWQRWHPGDTGQEVFQAGPPIMVVSRSHPGPEVNEYRKNLEEKKGHGAHPPHGEFPEKSAWWPREKADIYPRLGATSEWDYRRRTLCSGSGGGFPD